MSGRGGFWIREGDTEFEPVRQTHLAAFCAPGQRGEGVANVAARGSP